MTFGELRDDASRLANAMRELAAPGDRVAILAENIPEYVECYYGVPAAGMALTFLNYRLHPQGVGVDPQQRRGQRPARRRPKFLEQIEPLLGEVADASSTSS